MNGRIILIIFVCFALHISITDADTFYYVKGGKVSNVTVLSETSKKLEYRTENSTDTISVSIDRVKLVEYSDSPEDFIQGKIFFSKGEYSTAAECFEKSLNVPDVRDWIKQYACFFQGEVYRKWGESDTANPQKLEKAMSFYDQLLKTYPDSRFKLDSLFGIGKCYYYMKQYQKSSDFFEKLARDAEDLKLVSFSQEWYHRANLWKAKTCRESGELYKAIAIFKSLSKVEDFKDIAKEALIEEGRSYLGEKKFDEVESYFDQVKKGNFKDDPDVIAGAYNNLAESYLLKGNIHEARKLIVEVILKYIKSKEQHARAFYLDAQCYENLKDKNGNFYLEQAQCCYKFLTLGYPNSEWAKKAKEKLRESK